MNIDTIIAGPDPIAGVSSAQVNGPESEAIFAKVMARTTHLDARKPRVRRRVFAGTGVFATVAAAVTLVAVSLGSVVPSTLSAGAAELTHLAAHIQATATTPLQGDSTLVIRTTTNYSSQSPSGLTRTETDLYTDSGQYFSTPAENGLPGAIATNADLSNGFTAREIKAAMDAVNGNLATATQEMALAPFDNGVQPTSATFDAAAQQKIDANPNLTAAQKAALIQKIIANVNSPSGQRASTDNYIWMDSMDALIEGAGNPQIRIGVLRILSTLPEVAVANTTTNGQPTITLTAGAFAFPANYQEAITLDATTGVPVTFVGGTPGQSPDVTISYQVSRVTVANIAAGNF